MDVRNNVLYDRVDDPLYCHPEGVKSINGMKQIFYTIQIKHSEENGNAKSLVARAEACRKDPGVCWRPGAK